MPYRPRAERDRERVLTVLRAAETGGGAAMDRALAQIGAAFGEAAAVNAFKMRVERFIQYDPQHPAVRARFGARAAMLAGRSLDAATLFVERCWRDERRAFQIASALGCGNRLSLEVLRELRLVLRLMRFKHLHAEFGATVTALRDEAMPEAAE
jgi:hypothetical protein